MVFIILMFLFIFYAMFIHSQMYMLGIYSTQISRPTIVTKVSDESIHFIRQTLTVGFSSFKMLWSKTANGLPFSSRFLPFIHHICSNSNHHICLLGVPSFSFLRVDYVAWFSNNWTTFPEINYLLIIYFWMYGWTQ